MSRLILMCVALTACDWSLQRMVVQERCEPGASTPWLAHGLCGQARPEGVVSYQSSTETPALTGLAADGQEIATIPLPVRLSTLTSGRQKFERLCATCHGFSGDGTSQVAENMALRRPPSLHESRIARAPDGHLFRVITSGYGLMPSYAYALDAQARWAVVAYVRVLQRSQRVLLSELSEDERKEALTWLR